MLLMLLPKRHLPSTLGPAQHLLSMPVHYLLSVAVVGMVMTVRSVICIRESSVAN